MNPRKRTNFEVKLVNNLGFTKSEYDESEYECLKRSVMDSSTSIPELHRRISNATIILFRNNGAKFVNFAKINHTCFAIYGNLIH
ncbi:hypothetical protein DVH24_006234 [Malus domestica]|uniref:Uncharacterized protein n=1 Tax=Malus domestica TaxID=3750 RepID=A0A498KC89_MALDO|nr:hypothetical protein DVH24_006234 [Malus domestica]